MDTHTICVYKEVDKKKYTGCNLNTTELLDCALKGICAAIRWNTVAPNSSAGMTRLILFFVACFVAYVRYK